MAKRRSKVRRSKVRRSKARPAPRRRGGKSSQDSISAIIVLVVIAALGIGLYLFVVASQ